ncbi:unnamed protein product [Didymodactylos carnosus]|uniref:SCP domain-containing protein n=1 Tax=Didymodactylos carnosus TaxID=1234261 RepID=A0A815MMM3_9BILA|nr:unnamed protein product [Didymodactylos carnosus]CAF1418347.1 unnamed protein product [Didymodactylos carnosus]CAF4191307.1 unnamed protein product [Didymodactylos carnosus]CAF4302988.1 unnamed protein product [Didymodactylos carnosus]
MNSISVVVLLMLVCSSLINASRLEQQLKWLKRNLDQSDLPSSSENEDDSNSENGGQEILSLSGLPQIRGLGWDESSENMMKERSIGKRDLNSFRQQALDAHNQYRRKHCVPVMTLDSNLNNKAQQYAQYLAQNNVFQHSNHQGMGENLWMISTTGELIQNGADAVKAWYDEISSYNYGRPGFSMATGHFTQVVWRASNRLGIGAAIGNNGGWKKLYVVANYAPPGNYLGEFEKNVPRRCQ